MGFSGHGLECQSGDEMSRPAVIKMHNTWWQIYAFATAFSRSFFPEDCSTGCRYSQDDIAGELGNGLELCFQFRFSIATWRAVLFYVSGVKKGGKGPVCVCVWAFGVNGHLDDDKGDVEKGLFYGRLFLKKSSAGAGFRVSRVGNCRFR